MHKLPLLLIFLLVRVYSSSLAFALVCLMWGSSYHASLPLGCSASHKLIRKLVHQ